MVGTGEPVSSGRSLTLPAQDTVGQIVREEELSFCPAHTLAAYRPLGSMNRARLKAYGVMGALRRQENGSFTSEPRAPTQV